MKYFTSLIAAAVVASISPAAFAENTSVSVVYSDLDLTSADGQKTLKSRIARAANATCGFQNGRVSLYEASLNQACAAKAREQAVTAIKNRTEVQIVSR
jgi:UrcA family protein